MPWPLKFVLFVFHKRNFYFSIICLEGGICDGWRKEGLRYVAGVNPGNDPGVTEDTSVIENRGVTENSSVIENRGPMPATTCSLKVPFTGFTSLTFRMLSILLHSSVETKMNVTTFIFEEVAHLKKSWAS
jgi:hypothetical protein